MDEIHNKNITISSVEDTGTQIKIKDENKKIYSFFKLKRNGGETVAYSDFQNYQIGDRVGIGYKEVPYKDGKIKNILNFSPPFKETTQSPPLSLKAPQNGNLEVPEAIKDDTFWEKKAYKQCLWTYWLETGARSGKMLDEAEMDLVWDVFNQIDKDAEKRFHKVTGEDIPY